MTVSSVVRIYINRTSSIKFDERGIDIIAPDISHTAYNYLISWGCTAIARVRLQRSISVLPSVLIGIACFNFVFRSTTLISRKDLLWSVGFKENIRYQYGTCQFLRMLHRKQNEEKQDDSKWRKYCRDNRFSSSGQEISRVVPIDCETTANPTSTHVYGSETVVSQRTFHSILRRPRYLCPAQRLQSPEYREPMPFRSKYQWTSKYSYQYLYVQRRAHRIYIGFHPQLFFRLS